MDVEDGMRVLLRDRIAWFLANQVLRIATPWYRKMIEGSILYGLASATRDEANGTSPPSLTILKGETS